MSLYVFILYYSFRAITTHCTERHYDGIELGAIVVRCPPIRAEYLDRSGPIRAEYLARSGPMRAEYLDRSGPIRAEYLDRSGPMRGLHSSCQVSLAGSGLEPRSVVRLKTRLVDPSQHWDFCSVCLYQTDERGQFSTASQPPLAGSHYQGPEWSL